MNTFQHRVTDFVIEHKLEADVVYRLLDLMSELGELSKELLTLVSGNGVARELKM